ncbi:hypothetical protein TWF970_008168 [Orbilia oligospora]|uniref:RRM domain-containing protein n=1 Tax=Orbilia oligospora TaxID=2813651 RepID=A0A7C8VJU7_ORBOL|nr:hypothetical protein TWF970_008168 [Orbilia oligospora]
MASQRHPTPSRLQRSHHRPQAPFRNASDSGRTQLFVENLPAIIDEPKFRKRFEIFGNLENVSILTGLEPRVGTCTYSYADDALAAYHGMNRTLFEGNTLKAILAEPLETYEEARARWTLDGTIEPSPLAEFPETITSGNDAPRNQMCDHQDEISGHICGESFPNAFTLMRHWWMHTWNYRPWKCEMDVGCVYARRGFITESERDRHHGSTHVPTGDPRPYKCPVPSCHYHKKGFETQNAESLHEKVHSLGFEEHVCPISGCGFESTQSEEINHHLEDIHGIIENPSSSYPAHTLDAGYGSQRRSTPHNRRKRPSAYRSDEKSDFEERSHTPMDSEKADMIQRYAVTTGIDYRPFKCQVRGCKFVKEGFETQSELLSHEDREHDGQRNVLFHQIGSESPSHEVTSHPTLPPLKPTSSSISHTDAPRSPSPEFLQCNNVDCAKMFALEQDWRKHAISCASKSVEKQCSFTDCQARFDSVPALSSHEFGSHGIRICSSLTCNRAFHQLEDAESHMRDLHSNLYSGGRRPRLAFIASVPSWNEEIGETGFPYDPYRCALLNISQDKSSLGKAQSLQHHPSKKGKEIAREPIDAAGAIKASFVFDGGHQTIPPQSQPSTSSTPFPDVLPRYSVVMSQQAPRDSQTWAGEEKNVNLAQNPTPPGLLRADHAVKPAPKPEAPLVVSSPASRAIQQHTAPPTKSKFTPEDMNPVYRYNTDGSRYATGAVVLSPDKHQVLVLRSKDESKGIMYQLPSGFLEFNDQNMEASALRECWQNAGIVGRILRAIEPAPAEEPDENGLADWHSYFEIEVEREKERWPKYQLWHRRWLNYREARVVLSSQPDAIRALERSTIFKRGSSNLRADSSSGIHSASHLIAAATPPKSSKTLESVRPRRRQYSDERPPATRKYSTVSPVADNITAWRKDILPWLRRNFSTVMGKNKHGAIELLRVRNKPTICITCSDPKELVLDTFAEVVSGLFPMHVKVGLLARSSRQGVTSPADSRSLEIPSYMPRSDDIQISGGLRHGNDDADNADGSIYHSSLRTSAPEPLKVRQVSPRPEKAFRPPPIFGKYLNRPSCGATIGTVRDDDSSISAGTFGGIVILVKEDGTEAPYGLISHHVIEEKTDETELGIGVDEGWLFNSSGAHKFPIQQPAHMDLEEAKDSLDMQRYYCDREKRYCDVDDGRAVRAKLALLDGLDQQTMDFGHVAYSSGYGFDANRHQMDWALIGDIPSWRLEDNIVPSVESFYDLHYDGSPKAPYPVEKSFFNFLSETFEQEYSIDLSEIDPLRRIHGVGSYSGIMDGTVSSETAFFRLDGMDSEEWFFTPRYNGGLGVRGDSGTWIFDDFGKVVGQIIAYNYRTDTAYFTRMDYLFEHIKSKTKAVEVYIPYKGELARWKTDEAPKQLDTAQTASVTDASSSYVDSAFGTIKTNDTDITSPLAISDSGLGWAGFHKQN